MSEQLYRWIKASEETPKQCGTYEIIGINNQGNPTPPHDIWFTGTRWAARKGCEVVFWKKVTPSPSGSLEDAAAEYAKDCVGEYDPELQDDYDDIKRHFIAGATQSSNNYEDVLKDHKRLVRELDEIINGKEGMAEQASLCDIVAQMSKEYSRPSKDIVDRLREKCPIGRGMAWEDRYVAHWNECCDKLLELLNGKK